MVGCLITQDLPQVALIPDEGAVQELAAAAADPAFGDCVHAGVRMLQSTVRTPAPARAASTTPFATVGDEDVGYPLPPGADVQSGVHVFAVGGRALRRPRCADCVALAVGGGGSPVW